MNPTEEVKKKKELSGLPNSIIKKTLQQNDNDIKKTRAQLRKYYGLFLTNNIRKKKGTEILTKHTSSKQRNYQEYYNNLFEKERYHTIIDLGCGANGYSYHYLQEQQGNNITYIGIEAAQQLVQNTNEYYKEQKYDKAQLLWEDLNNTKKIITIIKKTKRPKAILLLQITDALEQEKNYTKTLLEEINKTLTTKDCIIISNPEQSINKKTRFKNKRTWLKNYLQEHYNITKEWKQEGEQYYKIQTKT
jgi:hypothetical protein